MFHVQCELGAALQQMASQSGTIPSREQRCGGVTGNSGGAAAAAASEAQAAMLFPPQLRPHALLLQAADSHRLSGHLQRCCNNAHLTACDPATATGRSMLVCLVCLIPRRKGGPCFDCILFVHSDSAGRPFALTVVGTD